MNHDQARDEAIHANAFRYACAYEQLGVEDREEINRIYTEPPSSFDKLSESMKHQKDLLKKLVEVKQEMEKELRGVYGEQAQERVDNMNLIFAQVYDHLKCFCEELCPQCSAMSSKYQLALRAYENLCAMSGVKGATAQGQMYRGDLLVQWQDADQFLLEALAEFEKLKPILEKSNNLSEEVSIHLTKEIQQVQKELDSKKAKLQQAWKQANEYAKETTSNFCTFMKMAAKGVLIGAAVCGAAVALGGIAAASIVAPVGGFLAANAVVAVGATAGVAAVYALGKTFLSGEKSGTKSYRDALKREKDALDSITKVEEQYQDLLNGVENVRCVGRSLNNKLKMLHTSIKHTKSNMKLVHYAGEQVERLRDKNRVVQSLASRSEVAFCVVLFAIVIMATLQAMRLSVTTLVGACASYLIFVVVGDQFAYPWLLKDAMEKNIQEAEDMLKAQVKKHLGNSEDIFLEQLENWKKCLNRVMQTNDELFETADAMKTKFGRRS